MTPLLLISSGAHYPRGRGSSDRIFYQSCESEQKFLAASRTNELKASWPLMGNLHRQGDSRQPSEIGRHRERERAHSALVRLRD